MVPLLREPHSAWCRSAKQVPELVVHLVGCLTRTKGHDPSNPMVVELTNSVLSVRPETCTLRRRKANSANHRRFTRIFSIQDEGLILSPWRAGRRPSPAKASSSHRQPYKRAVHQTSEEMIS